MQILTVKYKYYFLHTSGMDNSMIKKANELFQKVNESLSQRYKGKIIAIETESGQYYVGDSELEAYNKAIKQHPKKQFVFKRIGFQSTYFVDTEKEVIVLSTDANFALAGMDLFHDCRIMIERHKRIVDITKTG